MAVRNSSTWVVITVNIVLPGHFLTGYDLSILSPCYARMVFENIFAGIIFLLITSKSRGLKMSD